VNNSERILCKNKSIVSGKTGECKCICKSGTKGKFCQYSNKITCNNNGIVNDNGECKCYNGYAGKKCQYSKEETCNNVGIVKDDGTCDCSNTGFEGLNCETPLKCILGTNKKDKNQIDCNGNGEAAGKTNNCYCKCDTGFSWDSIGTTNSNCKNLLNCTLDGFRNSEKINCLNGGKAMGKTGSCKCDCKGTGYKGDHCETLIKICEKKPCLHGFCTNLLNDFKCTCDNGYEGKKCIKKILCEEIIEKCVNGDIIGDSSNNTCQCKCNVGWTGISCEEPIPCTIDGKNNSQKIKCSNGGIINGEGNNCSCDCTNTGYEGYTCNSIIYNCNIDSCDQDGVNLCIPKVPNPKCDCKEGYFGEKCEQISECTLGEQNTTTTINCNNKGNASGNTGNCKCDCFKGWGGNNCDTKLKCSDNQFNTVNKEDINCNFNGIPDGYTGDCKCNCFKGWDGKNCENELICLDSSIPSTTQTPIPSTTQTPIPSTTQTPIPPITQTPITSSLNNNSYLNCNNNGDIQGSGDNCSCKCDTGFDGINCMVNLECRLEEEKGFCLDYTTGKCLNNYDKNSCLKLNNNLNEIPGISNDYKNDYLFKKGKTCDDFYNKYNDCNDFLEKDGDNIITNSKLITGTNAEKCIRQIWNTFGCNEKNSFYDNMNESTFFTFFKEFSEIKFNKNCSFYKKKTNFINDFIIPKKSNNKYLSCSGNGIINGNGNDCSCICNKGYKGTNCEICESDYILDKNGNCSEKCTEYDCDINTKSVNGNKTDGCICNCNEGYLSSDTSNKPINCLSCDSTKGYISVGNNCKKQCSILENCNNNADSVSGFTDSGCNCSCKSGFVDYDCSINCNVLPEYKVLQKGKKCLDIDDQDLNYKCYKNPTKNQCIDILLTLEKSSDTISKSFNNTQKLNASFVKIGNNGNLNNPNDELNPSSCQRIEDDKFIYYNYNNNKYESTCINQYGYKMCNIKDDCSNNASQVSSTIDGCICTCNDGHTGDKCNQCKANYDNLLKKFDTVKVTKDQKFKFYNDDFTNNICEIKCYNTQDRFSNGGCKPTCSNSEKERISYSSCIFGCEKNWLNSNYNLCINKCNDDEERVPNGNCLEKCSINQERNKNSPYQCSDKCEVNKKKGINDKCFDICDQTCINGVPVGLKDTHEGGKGCFCKCNKGWGGTDCSKKCKDLSKYKALSNGNNCFDYGMDCYNHLDKIDCYKGLLELDSYNTNDKIYIDDNEISMYDYFYDLVPKYCYNDNECEGGASCVNNICKNPLKILPKSILKADNQNKFGNDKFPNDFYNPNICQRYAHTDSFGYYRFSPNCNSGNKTCLCLNEEGFDFCKNTIDCNNNAAEVLTSESGNCICRCKNGYIGDKCQYSDKLTCSDNGNVNNDGLCNCHTGYGGEDCSIILDCSTQENDNNKEYINCNGNGEAQGVTGSCSCKCYPPYKSYDCNLNCVNQPKFEGLWSLRSGDPCWHKSDYNECKNYISNDFSHSWAGDGYGGQWGTRGSGFWCTNSGGGSGWLYANSSNNGYIYHTNKQYVMTCPGNTCTDTQNHMKCQSANNLLCIDKLWVKCPSKKYYLDSNCQRDIGKSCTNNSDCSSNNCVNSKCGMLRKIGENCTMDTDCKSDLCLNTYGDYKCELKKEIGEDCIEDRQCSSNKCYKNKCLIQKEEGEDCTFNEECIINNCSNKKCKTG